MTLFNSVGAVKVVVTQLVKKSLAFCVTQMLIAMFRRIHNWSLS